ncbi:MAG: hypothetical protein U0636_07470 [Phycisphaerales bacterium]
MDAGAPGWCSGSGAGARLAAAPCGAARSGAAVARAGEPWPVIRLQARSAVLRLAAVAVGSLLVGALALGGVLALGTREQWVVPYVAGACGVGAVVGLLLGGVWSLAVAWMGCVRRAWCLDRPGAARALAG